MKKAWQMMELIFAFAAAMLVIVACVYVIPKAKDRDVWDILTAIGTIGAAGAAVGIATREGRRRRSQEMAAARLTAASIAYRANIVLNQVSHVLDGLENSHRMAPSSNDFGRYAGILEQGGLWTNEEVLQLIPLPDNCASKLAVAASQVEAAVVMMRSHAAEAGAPEDLSTFRAQGLHKMLTLCLERLESSIKTCTEAAGIFKKEVV